MPHEKNIELECRLKQITTGLCYQTTTFLDRRDEPSRVRSWRTSYVDPCDFVFMIRHSIALSIETTSGMIPITHQPEPGKLFMKYLREIAYSDPAAPMQYVRFVQSLLSFLSGWFFRVPGQDKTRLCRECSDKHERKIKQTKGVQSFSCHGCSSRPLC